MYARFVVTLRRPYQSSGEIQLCQEHAVYIMENKFGEKCKRWDNEDEEECGYCCTLRRQDV